MTRSALLSRKPSELFENKDQSYQLVQKLSEHFPKDHLAPSDNVAHNKESILDSFSRQLNDRQVRHLIGVWTKLSEIPERLWNLSMFFALMKDVKPEVCSYEDSNLNTAERRFWNPKEFQFINSKTVDCKIPPTKSRKRRFYGHLLYGGRQQDAYE